MGGLPFPELGNSTSARQTSTHVLQPLHSLGSIIIAWHGVIGLGTIIASISIIASPFTLGSYSPAFLLKTTMLIVILFIRRGIRWQEPVVDRQLSNLNIPILQPEGDQFVPLRWIHLGIV